MSYFDECAIVRDYINGIEISELAKLHNTYNTSIRRVLVRNKIPTRNASEVHSKVVGNPFSTRNEQVDYWIGFLSADGCLYQGKIEVSTAEVDNLHLDKFITFLGGKIAKIKYLNKRFNTYTYKVAFRHKQSYQDLFTYGLTPNKSLTLSLNIELNWNILRGIIDGDGCFRKINTKLKHGGKIICEIGTASEDLKIQIVEFLERNNIECSCTKNKNIHLITIRKQNSVITLINNLYINASVFLDRKYSKVCHLIEKSISKTP